MSVCIIEQSCGLGDILLGIKVAHHYVEQGHRVIWAVEPIYQNLKNNIIVTEGIEFPCVLDDFDYKKSYDLLATTQISDVTDLGDFLYVPLRRASYSLWSQQMQQQLTHDARNMLGKFGMCGLEHNDWQDFFSIRRNLKKERQLEALLGIGPDDDLHIVNQRFGTPPRWNEILKKRIETLPFLKRIEMDIIKGYDLFDWIGILERAKKIDSVETATFYFFEKIDLQCVPTLYSRNTPHRSEEENFGWVKTLAKKPYKYIC
jgi:hypothetical protein